MAAFRSRPGAALSTCDSKAAQQSRHRGRALAHGSHPAPIRSFARPSQPSAPVRPCAWLPHPAQSWARAAAVG
eukprot:scaffold7641_cov430-Prasinococcus_capsulatus_cf.AAC.4